MLSSFFFLLYAVLPHERLNVAGVVQDMQSLLTACAVQSSIHLFTAKHKATEYSPHKLCNCVSRDFASSASLGMPMLTLTQSPDAPTQTSLALFA
jgi:hypothetical protein